MATGPEHYTEAERMRAEADEWMDADLGWKANLTARERIDLRIADLADAQVHATLALAAATAMGSTGLCGADLVAWEVAAVAPTRCRVHNSPFDEDGLCGYCEDGAPVQAEPSSRLANAKRAHAALGKVMDALPSDFEGHAWTVETLLSEAALIKIQQGSGIEGDEYVRLSIRSAATVLGFAYEEKQRPGYIHVRAIGEIDGVTVEVWDHARHAEAEHVDYAEAADVREIERDLAIEAGDDSDLDRQVAEDDARNERNTEARYAEPAYHLSEPDPGDPDYEVGTEAGNCPTCEDWHRPPRCGDLESTL